MPAYILTCSNVVKSWWECYISGIRGWVFLHVISSESKLFACDTVAVFGKLFVSMDFFSWIIISFVFHCCNTIFLSCKGPTPLNQLNRHFFCASLLQHHFSLMQRSHALESVESSFLLCFTVATLIFSHAKVQRPWISWIVIYLAFYCRNTHFLPGKSTTPLNQLNRHFFRVSLSPHSFSLMQRSHALESVESSFLSRFTATTLIFSQAKVPRPWIGRALTTKAIRLFSWLKVFNS